MNSTRLFATLLTTGMLAWAPAQASADENQFVDLLGGQALKNKKVRSFVQPEVRTETRSLYFSPRSIRGIPKGVTAIDRESKTKLTLKKAPTKNKDSDYGDLAVNAGDTAYEISYDVDPTSELSAKSIKFVKGGIDLADAGSAIFLNKLTTALKDSKLKGYKYVIEGHASAEGSAQSNQSLSQDRANAIFNHLVRNGVPEDRIFPVGWGESKARFAAHSAETNLAKDRRVLIFKLED